MDLIVDDTPKSSRARRSGASGQWIILGRGDIRAVAAVQPALNYFILFGNTCVIGHEHQTTWPLGIFTEALAIAHATPNDTRRRPTLKLPTRIAQPDMGIKGTMLTN